MVEVASLGRPEGPEEPPSYYTNGKLEALGYHVIGQYPKPETIEAPKHVPDEIAEHYREATAILRGSHFTGATMMLRTVLELAVSDLMPGTGGRKKPLIHSIDALAGQSVLTPDMQNLAHLVRLDGNKAAHGEGADESTAKELHEFTELFLIYMYTLPARIKERSDAALQDRNQARPEQQGADTTG